MPTDPSQPLAGSPGVAPALLVDYGGVISLPQDESMVAEMASLAELPLPAFRERYWAHRPAYDAGVQPDQYWSAVLEHSLDDGERLRRLIALDLDSWSAMNPDTLEVLRLARERGSSLALLSNAPFDLAEMLSEHRAMAGFEHLLFSSRLGLVKPHREAFEAALARIGRGPAEVLFIDDRADNVAGARAAGLRAIHFTSAEQLRAELLDALP